MKLSWIDSLRGLGVLGVIIIHCGAYGNNSLLPFFMKAIVWSGKNGVQLFYVASAFTLFLSFSSRIGKENNPIYNFFIRRIFRIAPMYYIGILYFGWIVPYRQSAGIDGQNSQSFWNVLTNIFFIHGISPYWIHNLVPGGWSISVEMTFYCLLPFLFFKIKNAQQAFNFLLITLVVRVILYLIFSHFQLIENDELWSVFLYFYLPNQLPIFALGIVLYYIIKDNYAFKISPNMIYLSVLVILIQLVSIKFMLLHLIFGIGFVILGIALSKNYLKFIVNPILIFIGKISFSMYLVHFAVLSWLSEFGMVDYIIISNPFTATINYLIRLLIVIIITALISFGFYKLVELPMQNVGKRLITKLNRKYNDEVKQINQPIPINVKS